MASTEKEASGQVGEGEVEKEASDSESGSTIIERDIRKAEENGERHSNRWDDGSILMYAKEGEEQFPLHNSRSQSTGNSFSGAYKNLQSRVEDLADVSLPTDAIPRLKAGEPVRIGGGTVRLITPGEGGVEKFARSDVSNEWWEQNAVRTVTKGILKDNPSDDFFVGSTVDKPGAPKIDVQGYASLVDAATAGGKLKSGKEPWALITDGVLRRPNSPDIHFAGRFPSPVPEEPYVSNLGEWNEAVISELKQNNFYLIVGKDKAKVVREPIHMFGGKYTEKDVPDWVPQVSRTKLMRFVKSVSETIIGSTKLESMHGDTVKGGVIPDTGLVLMYVPPKKESGSGSD